MPGPNAQQLIRGLGSRLQEFILSTPSGGSATTLIDQKLQQFFPQDISQLFAWVSGVPGSDAANIGVEVRSSAWTFANFTLTLFAPGFPTGVSKGPYEIHIRYPRSLILEALNDAIGQLGLTWYREVKDDSILTVQPGWRYQLPASQNWANVTRVELQINTDAANTAAGYPFAPADYLNPRPQRFVDTQGNEIWEIQFGLQPPPGRILRVWGEAFYSDLVLDTDFVPLAGKWMRPALRWIYSMATFNLQDWTNNRQPTSQMESARQKAMDVLERQKNEVLALAPTHSPGKILTPGRGDGYPVESPSDWRYLRRLSLICIHPRRVLTKHLIASIVWRCACSSHYARRVLCPVLGESRTAGRQRVPTVEGLHSTGWIRRSQPASGCRGPKPAGEKQQGLVRPGGVVSYLWKLAAQRAPYMRQPLVLRDYPPLQRNESRQLSGYDCSRPDGSNQPGSGGKSKHGEAYGRRRASYPAVVRRGYSHEERTSRSVRSNLPGYRLDYSSQKLEARPVIEFRSAAFTRGGS